MMEKDQGRFFPKEANNSRCYDVAYWKNYRSTLMNSNAGKHIFHWLCRRNIKDFNIRDIPRGDYEKQLAKIQVSPVVKWMLDVRQKFLDTANSDEKIMTADESYDDYREWSSENAGSKSAVVSKAAFAKILVEYLGSPTRMQKILTDKERSAWFIRKGVNLPTDPKKKCSIYYRSFTYKLLNEKLSSVLTHDEQNEQIE
jgi:hypothetical protein